LVQEYVLKGLLAEGKSITPNQNLGPDSQYGGGALSSLEVQARQIVKDRLELIELGSKVHAVMNENSLLKAESQAHKLSLAKARKKIQSLTKKLEKENIADPHVFLGMTAKELLLIGIPTALFLFEKYKSGKAEEASELLTSFKHNISKLPEERRKEALQVLSNAAIPWPKQLKTDVFQALGAKI
jgi:hypothetical protein